MIFIGIDGSGPGLRVRVEAEDGVGLSTATGPAVSLTLGTGKAWQMVLETLSAALKPLGQATETLTDARIVLALPGLNLPAQQQLFTALNPLPGSIWTCPDSYAALVGGLGDQPGSIILLGAGSVLAARRADGTWYEIGGWGFPTGDEGSAAWLGQQLVTLTQRALDGRQPWEPLTRLCYGLWGGAWDAFFERVATAIQADYAALAAPIAEMAAAEDALAQLLLMEAGREVGAMAAAADPDARLPLALTGSLAPVLAPYLPPEATARLVAPEGTALDGALRLARAPEPPPAARGRRLVG